MCASVLPPLNSDGVTVPKRAVVALLILVAAVPVAAVAQAPAQAPIKPEAKAAPAQGPGQAEAAPAPLSWTDATLRQESYATPPKELVDAVLAPRYKNVALTSASPDKKWFLDEIGDGPVTMAVFSKPFHELGGLFVDVQANRVRPLTIRNSAGLQVISAADGSKKPIQTPASARVSNAAWSPDGSLIAFYVHTPDATHVWVADPMTGISKQLTPKPVLATLVSSFDFSADGKKIAAVVIPDGRAPMPKAPAAPSGPQVKVADDGDKNRLRTFPSLMATPYDFELLEWHATGQIVVLDVTPPAAVPARGRAPKPVPAAMKKIGQPQMVRSLDLSPDGTHLHVTRMVKPFSYVVPVSRFGSIDEVWDLDGKVMVELDKRPLNLGVQDDTQAQQQGRRELAWRADGQGLTFLEQEPAPPAAAGDATAGGPPAAAPAAPAAATGRGGRGGAGEGGQQARRPDRLYQWLPPFDKASLKVLFENSTRMSGHRFSPDHQTLFFSERAGQNTVEIAVSLAEPAKRYTISRFRADDIYANPGSTCGPGGPRGSTST